MSATKGGALHGLRKAVGGLFGAKTKYELHDEYWVYLAGSNWPSQNALMDWILRRNPYAKLGSEEALLFSDVRLHISRVQRAKNHHVFRPDLFEETDESAPSYLGRLADCESMMILRYHADEPVPNFAHLRLLPFLASGVVQLGGGALVIDRVAQRWMSPEDLDHRLRIDPACAEPTGHWRVVWRSKVDGGVARTAGLVKKGLQEVVSDTMSADQRVLCCTLLEALGERLWAGDEVTESLPITSFGGDFRAELKPGKSERTVTLYRL